MSKVEAGRSPHQLATKVTILWKKMIMAVLSIINYQKSKGRSPHQLATKVTILLKKMMIMAV